MNSVCNVNFASPKLDQTHKLGKRFVQLFKIKRSRKRSGATNRSKLLRTLKSLTGFTIKLIIGKISVLALFKFHDFSVSSLKNLFIG